VSLNFSDTHHIEQIDVAKLNAKLSKSHLPAQNRGKSEIKLGQQYVKTVANPKQTLVIDYRPNKEVRKPSFKPKSSIVSTEMCPLCLIAHPMFRCKKFLTLEIKQKFAVVQANRLCYHFLSARHCISKCTYNQGKPCSLKCCVRYHHQLLHINPKKSDFFTKIGIVIEVIYLT
jgi:hypothetical protein